LERTPRIAKLPVLDIARTLEGIVGRRLLAQQRVEDTDGLADVLLEDEVLAE
jgi:CBS-domain-containing membrane protein